LDCINQHIAANGDGYQCMVCKECPAFERTFRDYCTWCRNRDQGRGGDDPSGGAAARESDWERLRTEMALYGGIAEVAGSVWESLFSGGPSAPGGLAADMDASFGESSIEDLTQSDEWVIAGEGESATDGGLREEAVERSPPSFEKTLQAWSDDAVSEQLAWSDAVEGRGGTPLDIDGNGVIGRGDGLMYENANSTADVYVDTNGDGMLDYHVHIADTGESYSEPLLNEGCVLHSEPMPAIPDGVDPGAYRDTYSSYKQAESVVNELNFSEGEVRDVLVDYAVTQPILDLVPGEIVGQIVDPVLNLEQKIAGLLSDNASEALDYESYIEGLADLKSAASAAMPSLEILAGQLNVDSIARAYEHEYYSGNTYIFDSADGVTGSVADLSAAQVKSYAQTRAQRFVKYVEALRSYSNAGLALEQLYAGR